MSKNEPLPSGCLPEPDETIDQDIFVDVLTVDDQPKGRGNGRAYEVTENFQNEGEFIAWVNGQNLWTRHEKRYVKKYDCDVVSYKCKYDRRKNANCPARLIGKIYKDGTVSVETSGDHSEHAFTTTALTEEAKKAIQSYKQRNPTHKAQKIQQSLAIQFPDLTRVQIQNYLQRIGETGSVLRWSTVESILQSTFLQGRSDVEPENMPYVFVKECQDNGFEVTRFVIGFTTPFLFERLQKQNTINVDGTYRLIKDGYCMIVFGHCDITRRFLPAGFAICNSENSWAYEQIFRQFQFEPKSIMADGLSGLQSAMKSGFTSQVKRLMCFYHAKTAMERKMGSLKLNKAQKIMILDAIRAMQLSETELEFFKVAELALTEWREFGHHQITDFADYFESTWANKEDAECRWRWFEGASQFGSTNNSLESFNGHFKDTVTERQRHELSAFIPALRNSLLSFSVLREFREQKLKPDMDLDTMRKAHELVVKRRKYKSFGQGSYYLVASSSCVEDVTSKDLTDMYDKLRLANFETMNEYLELRNSVYLLKLQGQYYSCSCFVGQKTRTQCKHAIFCAVIQGLFVFPPNVRDPILPKRRRVGRPAGARGGGALSQR